MLSVKTKRFSKMILIVIPVLLLIAIALYAIAPHRPAVPSKVHDTEELDTFFDALVAPGNPPGLAVVVVKDRQIVYNHAFGFADGPRGIHSTPDTVYHWWSMTKIPTAMAIMQLQEQGKLSLDDPVTKYLPWFQAVYSSENKPAITIRNLLQHSSGLPDTMPAMIGWVHYDDQPRNQTEIARQYLSKFNKLKFEPGTHGVYSNYNYMLLGAVIEAVSGEPYESYMTTHILKPLGMSHTSFVYSTEMSEHEAAGSLPIVHFYTPLLPFLLDTRALIRERQGNLFWFHRLYIDATPSTGLVGSAPDVACLMAAYLNNGAIDGTTILSPQSVSELTATAGIDGHGLGWFVGELNGKPYLEHAGGGPGFATEMMLFPGSNLGLVILANGTDLDRTRLSNLLSGIDW
jgi:CubicO group peptidase (beta-lactamase class C family)